MCLHRRLPLLPPLNLDVDVMPTAPGPMPKLFKPELDAEVNAFRGLLNLKEFERPTLCPPVEDMPVVQPSRPSASKLWR